jgi:hypothetical protein
MEDTKKYEVLADIVIGEETHYIGESVDLTDEQAVEYGDSIKLIEEGQPTGQGVLSEEE